MLQKYIELLKNPPKGYAPPRNFHLESHFDSLPDHLRPLWMVDLHEKTLPAEPGFALLWRGHEFLHVMCIMADSNAHSLASGKNRDKTWELGDVMELFLQIDSSQPEYLELHVTPSKATLELSISNAAHVRAGNVVLEQLHTDSKMASEVGFFDNDGIKGWWGHIRLPIKTFDSALNPVAPPRFAVCRYNYAHNTDESPVLSSTCTFPHIPSFHQPELWHSIS